eukprot:scaffold36414_cov27-Tisochrysis_lutea.AAC.1
MSVSTCACGDGRRLSWGDAACHLELLARPLVPHHGDVGQSLLTGGKELRHLPRRARRGGGGRGRQA